MLKITGNTEIHKLTCVHEGKATLFNCFVTFTVFGAGCWCRVAKARNLKFFLCMRKPVLRASSLNTEAHNALMCHRNC